MRSGLRALRGSFLSVCSIQRQWQCLRSIEGATHSTKIEPSSMFMGSSSSSSSSGSSANKGIVNLFSSPGEELVS